MDCRFSIGYLTELTEFTEKRFYYLKETDNISQGRGAHRGQSATLKADKKVGGQRAKECHRRERKERREKILFVVKEKCENANALKHLNNFTDCVIEFWKILSHRGTGSTEKEKTKVGMGLTSNYVSGWQITFKSSDLVKWLNG